jgi:chromatin assembly factor 1 subunit A
VAGSGDANASHYRTGSGTPYPGTANSLAKTNHTNWKVPTQAASTRLATFPEEHIQALLHGIQRCKTASLNVLVDTLYQELKQVKVKKNSIERKVREIAEKRLDSDLGSKIWTVKLEYLQGQLSVA